MAVGTYQFQSDFAKRYYGQGLAEGRAGAIVTILEARGLVVAPELRSRILACADVATLDVWLTRAATAKAAHDVVAE